MTCCLSGSALQPDAMTVPEGRPSRDEVLFASNNAGDGLLETHIFVPGIHCGGCISAIEKAMATIPGIHQARVNLSAKKLVVHWTRDDADPESVFNALDRLGYTSHLDDGSSARNDDTLRRLFLSLGVAGFAAANVMLLSVSIWSGADGSTRDLFHWISALIAIPAVGYAGQPFFRPALRALRAKRVTMDVPISLAVILAVGMSVYETWNHGENAYFDASVTLLFFLLIGRVLDHVMRERARGAVTSLGQLAPSGATVVALDGSRDWLPLEDVKPGMTLFIAPGQRLPVDGVVVTGGGEIDCSIATGESDPLAALPGKSFPAGAMAIGSPVVLRANRTARQSFLAEMVTMLEAAESAKPAFRRLSDKAAAIYVPAVHLAAFLAFLGWLFVTGDWHKAIYTAIATLIITCPCALGLAVPIVQVVTAGRLAKMGILVSDGAAMEKLAEVDRVLFDKTGTLTTGAPALRDMEHQDKTVLALAGSLAANSRHPYSRALVAAAESLAALRDGAEWSSIHEEPGQGIEAQRNGALYRLGKAQWALTRCEEHDQDGVVLSHDGEKLAVYQFDDTPRAGAAETVSWLAANGYSPEIVSGDAPAKVSQTAAALSVDVAEGGLSPADKIARIHALQAEGHRVLMVGDGINDAPALNAADTSIAPSTAADVGRRAAGFVFLHEGLDAVQSAIKVAKQSRRLIRQNFALAVVYNMIAVPVAVMGLATPLVAAIAMSASSFLVIANAMRLNIGTESRVERTPVAKPVARQVAPVGAVAGEAG